MHNHNKDIYKILQNTLCKELDFYLQKNSENELEIETPFTYNDNEIICFWIIKQENGYKITDKGLIYEKLFDYLMPFYEKSKKEYKKEMYLKKIKHFSEKYKVILDANSYEFIKIFNIVDERYLKFLVLDFTSFLQRAETFTNVYFNYVEEKTINNNFYFHIDVRKCNVNDKKLENLKNLFKKFINNDVRNIIDSNIRRKISYNIKVTDKIKITPKK